jgi:hypothetical protein
MNAAVWTWSLAILSADLKSSVFAYIHWAATIAFIAFAFPELRRRRLMLSTPAALLGLGMIVAVLIASAPTYRNPDPLYGVVQAVKLAALLFGGMSFFETWPECARVVHRAFIASACLNAALLVVGAPVSAAIASEMAAGRWGTFLNWPGSLWRTGILVVVYALYRISAAREGRVRSLGLLAIGVGVMIADGARTGFLLLPFAIAYWGALVLFERRRDLAPKLLVAVLAAGVLFVLVRMVTGYENSGRQPEESGVLSRVALLWTSLSDMGVEGLAAADPTRFAMIEEGINAIQRDPVFGGGIGTTRSATDEGQMVVHMTYIQVWADIGLLGFVCYLGIVLGWMRWLPRAFAAIAAMPSADDRAMHHNAIFLLFVFAFTGLMHPLSTEWSEWITFLAPLGLVSGAVGERGGTPAAI